VTASVRQQGVFAIVVFAALRVMSAVCNCGEAPERANDFFWENDRTGFRAYGPGDVHKWSGIDVFNKCVSTNIVVHWLRHRSSPNFHLNQGQGMDNYAVGPGRGVGGVALRKDGKWLPDYGNWIRYRVLTNCDERCAFELDYKLPIGGEMTLAIALPRGSSFFSEEVSFSPDVPLDGVEVAVGLDTSAARKHVGDYYANELLGIVSLFEKPHLDKDGKPIKGEEGSMMSAICAVAGKYEIVEGPYGETMLLGKELPRRKSDGRPIVAVLVGADWTEAGRFKTASEWHDYVKNGKEPER